MKDFIDKSIEEFNEEFMVRVSGDKALCLRNEDDVFVTKPMILKDFFRQKLQEAIEYGKKECDKEYGSFSNRMNEALNKSEKDFKQSAVVALENKEEERSEMASMTDRDLFEDIGYQQAIEDAIKIIKEL